MVTMVTTTKDHILSGDVFNALDFVENNSISVVITSPPYWKQRDYKIENQIGQESTPEEYIGRLLVIFDKLKRVLKEDGIFFLNVGDKYMAQYGKSHLLQLPYRIAFHMIKRGWILEDIIIWYKPNHMPSPVKDRFTNTYEPILVFSKNKKNIYKHKQNKVETIPLQPTPWKHTAVFPEKLVEALLNRVELKHDMTILDPFAGTGTTGAVVKKLSTKNRKLHVVLIEKAEEFVRITKERTKIEKIIPIDEKPYSWKPVKEFSVPSTQEKLINTNPYGEIYIADDPNEFLQIIAGLKTIQFQQFHREDALYFFGIQNWNIDTLYYVHAINEFNYVLRNMLIISDGSTWFPVFMIAKNSTKKPYRFFLDRIRVKPKTKETRKWIPETFIGMTVKDQLSKEKITGKIVRIIESYHDNFPRLVEVQWINGKHTIEPVLHPDKEELKPEFICPKCKAKLPQPYNPYEKNTCPSCGSELWTDLSNVPIITEPEQPDEDIQTQEITITETLNIDSTTQKITRKTKFASLDRINWGASPGARKLIIGDYFTRTRLYKVEQPLIAQYLTLLRKKRQLSLKELTSKFPSSYKHTVGHWFRKDLGGSIPLPEDIELLEKIFGSNELFELLKKSALKFQTVKTATKGKNPGDFLLIDSRTKLIKLLSALFLP